MSEANCSKGWGMRCAAAIGRKCRCACGGANHGKVFGRQDGESVSFNPSRLGEPTRRLLKAPRREPIRMVRVGGADPKDRTSGGEATVNVAHRWKLHSPTGFEWGYGGSGPADLALNILLEFVSPADAYRMHQDFKALIARVPDEGMELAAQDVAAWAYQWWADHPVPQGTLEV